MARPTNADAADTKERILQSAFKEYVQYGPGGARMKRIAERAGVNHALLHHYFESKSALHTHVLEFVFAPLSTLVDEFTERRALDPNEMKNIVAAAFDLYWRNQDFIRIIFWEIATQNEDFLEMVQPVYQKILAKIPAPDTKSVAMRSHDHDPTDVTATMIASVLFYFFQDPVLPMLFGDDRFSEEARQRRRAHLSALASLFYDDACDDQPRAPSTPR
ncbi:MAG: TetR/AcrR family transcriptional regulator [Polyangiales bacterium]